MLFYLSLLAGSNNDGKWNANGVIQYSDAAEVSPHSVGLLEEFVGNPDVARRKTGSAVLLWKVRPRWRDRLDEMQ